MSRGSAQQLRMQVQAVRRVASRQARAVEVVRVAPVTLTALPHQPRQQQYSKPEFSRPAPSEAMDPNPHVAPFRKLRAQMPARTVITGSLETRAAPKHVNQVRQPAKTSTSLAATRLTHYDASHAAPGLLAKLAAAGVSGSVSSSKGFPIAADQLLHRVSAGDSAAIQECIERFGGLVWSLARRSGLPETELEDAVHEIFTELWQNGHKYDVTIASEAAFVAIITRRRLIDRRRRISRRPVSAELTELNGGGTLSEESAPASVVVSEDAATAAKALESLSGEQQRVLRLSVYQGLSHELISRATGLPLGTVKTHARRGLIRLRELLGGAPGAEVAQGGEA
jgi:RNA polymerase sigma factor (sigma-70 family)